MNRSLTRQGRGHARIGALVVVALALFAAIAVGLTVAQVTMAPPRSEMLSLAAYFAASGSACAVIGWLALNSDWAGRHFSLRSKAFVGSIVGGIMGLFNVLLIARLMFISMSHDIYVLAAAIGFSVVVMAAFSLTVASSMAQRLELISDALRALADNRKVPHLDTHENDEVSRLAEDVERLSAKLDASEQERAQLDQQRVDLTAAISHDLRTPLASVRAMAEALADGVVDEEQERSRYYALMQREVERLDRMIGDLFDLAQIDSGALRLEKRLLPAQEIVSEVVEGMRPQALRAGIDLQYVVEAEELPDIPLDGSRFERAVSNLVRNALQHTPEGGEIRTSLSRAGRWVSLDVSDNGEGFDAEQAERVWDRFYRGDKARGRKAIGGDGAGLGLSIVRGFVEAHGGEVACSSSPGNGATFTLRLPVS